MTKSTVPWHKWTTGLDNGDETLSSVYRTMPGSPPNAVPESVRVLENPSSDRALAGAVSLFDHDMIHILLSRGMLASDEGFVLGTTMASAGISDIDISMFKCLAEHWYPAPFDLNEDALISFDLGIRFGKKLEADLSSFPYIRFMDVPLSELRERLGIDIPRLQKFYREELEFLPDSKAVKRLDFGTGSIK